MALKFLIDLLTGNLVLVNVPASAPTDPSLAVNNLDTQDGNHFLTQDGSYILLQG